MAEPRFTVTSLSGAKKGETEGWYVLDRAYCCRIVATFHYKSRHPERNARAYAALCQAEHDAHMEEIR